MLGQQKDEIFRSQVKLRAAVILQAVHLVVVAVAPTKLRRHTAEEGGLDLLGCLQAVDVLILRHILGSLFRAGSLLAESFHDGRHVVAFDHSSVRDELGIRHTVNLHILSFFL